MSSHRKNSFQFEISFNFYGGLYGFFQVSKYHDECVRRHKIVKDEMGPTQDAVKAVQEASLALTKAKDILRQKTAELEKLKQQQGSTGAGASGSGPPPNQKEIEKSEAKHRKAQEDYKVIHSLATNSILFC